MKSAGQFVAVAAIAVLTGACAGKISPQVSPAPAPQVTFLAFTATAYCQGTTTASGTRVARGTVAADPAVLPLGTRVRITGLADRYNGIYAVRDTGPSVRGRRIDLYMANCGEARRFGRRQAKVAIVPG